MLSRDIGSHITLTYPNCVFFPFTYSGRRAELRSLASVPEHYLLSLPRPCPCATRLYFTGCMLADPCWVAFTIHPPQGILELTSGRLCLAFLYREVHVLVRFPAIKMERLIARIFRMSILRDPRGSVLFSGSVIPATEVCGSHIQIHRTA